MERCTKMGSLKDEEAREEMNYLSFALEGMWKNSVSALGVALGERVMGLCSCLNVKHMCHRVICTDKCQKERALL